MAWQVIYEDLSSYSSETHGAGDLPLDGMQAVTIDGDPNIGMNCCGWDMVDGREVILLPSKRVSYSDMVAQYPDAIVVQTKTTSTRQFHKVEEMTGLWSELNKVPSETWMKDVIGWRVWTETEVFDSVGVPETDWFALWDSLPASGWQGLVLYENWETGNGNDYRQNFGGGDHYAIAPSDYGPVFLNNNDPIVEIERRYPGAMVKVGTQLADDAFAPIQARINAATVL